MYIYVADIGLLKTRAHGAHVLIQHGGFNAPSWSITVQGENKGVNNVGNYSITASEREFLSKGKTKQEITIF